MKKATKVFLFAVVIAVICTVSAEAQMKDAVDTKDHPLVTRYKGFYIIGYEQRAFDEFMLPLGKQVKDPEDKEPLAKAQRVEGKYTRILYVLPEDRSSLEVIRNYENALLQIRFARLFGCSHDECGKSFNRMARLTAKGVALLAPVAPNKTEEGRAKNRRVEMVEQ